MGRLIDSTLREKIMRNYGGGDLSCNALLSLLEERISPGAMRARNRLITLLAEAKRHFNRAAHTAFSKDSTMHYTIFIDGRGYHLRVVSRGVVFQITEIKDSQLHDLGTIPAWVPPGASWKPPTGADY